MMMISPDEDSSKECYLINAGILQITDIENIDELGGITILNLHCNKVSSLHGLPAFKCLTEINLSSNEFRDVDVSELVNLPNLLHLDMSGNYLNKLDNLPYLPSLETFSIAFNKISTLYGLDGFPALQNLDVRGNSLTTVESFSSIQVLSSLHNIQISSSDGRHANPICGHEAELINVFDSFFYLGTIDKKSRQDYANFLTEKTFGFTQEDGHHTSLKPHPQVPTDHPLDSTFTTTSNALNHPPESEKTSENTPKFDLAVQRFRHRLLEIQPTSQVDLVQNPDDYDTAPGTIGGVEVFEDASDEEAQKRGQEEEPPESDSSRPSSSHVSSPTTPGHRKAQSPLSSPSPQSPLNPWNDQKKQSESDVKENRVQRLLLKKNSLSSASVSKKISSFNRAPEHVVNAFPPRTELLNEQLQVSSGDDDSHTDTDIDVSVGRIRSYHGDPASTAGKLKALVHLSSKILLVTSHKESQFQVLRHTWQIWQLSTVVTKQQLLLLSCEETNAVLLTKTAQADADAIDQKAIADTKLTDVMKQLTDEQCRNASLQDRLIAMEHENTLVIAQHVSSQQAVAAELASQIEKTQEYQDALSQQENKYSQSLQSITTDVIHVTKVMEGKDTTITALQAEKHAMESEINQLHSDVKELTNAREQYVCADCVKMKTFFDTMQHDMQYLVERKVQLEHENAQVPTLKAQLTDLKAKLTATQLDFTKQVSEMQQTAETHISKDAFVELEDKHVEVVAGHDAALAAKEQIVQECLQELASAKEGMMEYDDKCVDMERLLKASHAKHENMEDIVSELNRAHLDLKKHATEMKKKDKLISEMREHVLEVKTMLKKLAGKCHALEYANNSQHMELEETQTEIKHLEEELFLAKEAKSAMEKQRENIVSANILLSQKAHEEGSSDSDSAHEKSSVGMSNHQQEALSVVNNNMIAGEQSIIEGETPQIDMVTRVVFEELLHDFDQLQGDYDVQAERLQELEVQLHEDQARREGDVPEQDRGEVAMDLSIEGVHMTPKELHESYLRQQTEHEDSMKDMTISLRIKDKMIDDQNNAIRRLKERHRLDETRVQETITLLEDDNEEIRNDLMQLEEQLDQSREQEKHCLKELQDMEQDRNAYQDKCKMNANEEIKPYRAAIQEKDDALERARIELASICEVVAEMQSQGLKKDHELKQFKKKLENVSEEVLKETNKYMKEKTAKAHLLKDVQKMRSEISQSRINKEDVIKDLKKSLKSKKILLLESHEKILHMEQLFGTFQQLAATLSAPPLTSRHVPSQLPQQQQQLQPPGSRPVSMIQGNYSLPIPSHLLLTEGALAHTIEKYNDANKGLKESISDMSVVSSDSDNDDQQNYNENLHNRHVHNTTRQKPKNTSKRRHKSPAASGKPLNKMPAAAKSAKPILQSKSPDRSNIPSTKKQQNPFLHQTNTNPDGSLAIFLPHSELPSSSHRHSAGRSYTDVELSATNSATILELSRSDDDDSSFRSALQHQQGTLLLARDEHENDEKDNVSSVNSNQQLIANSDWYDTNEGNRIQDGNAENGHDDGRSRRGDEEKHMGAGAESRDEQHDRNNNARKDYYFEDDNAATTPSGMSFHDQFYERYHDDDNVPIT